MACSQASQRVARLDKEIQIKNQIEWLKSDTVSYDTDSNPFT